MATDGSGQILVTVTVIQYNGASSQSSTLVPVSSCVPSSASDNTISTFYNQQVTIFENIQDLFSLQVLNSAVSICLAEYTAGTAKRSHLPERRSVVRRDTPFQSLIDSVTASQLNAALQSPNDTTISTIALCSLDTVLNSPSINVTSQ